MLGCRERNKACCKQNAPCQSFAAVARSEGGPDAALAVTAPLGPQGMPVICCVSKHWRSARSGWAVL